MFEMYWSPLLLFSFIDKGTCLIIFNYYIILYCLIKFSLEKIDTFNNLYQCNSNWQNFKNKLLFIYSGLVLYNIYILLDSH